jgi:biotin-dependent carboxylase-like uncharacterized protein
MALEVLEGGLLTTVQDLGRFGYERYGVPVAGAMDPFALQAANALVGNPLGEAGLEMTLLGPRLRAQVDCLVAVTGADLGAEVDGAPLPLWRAVWLPAGGTLGFAGLASGCRAYLAVAGGLDLPSVLGSLSTYVRGGFGGFQGRPLRPGDSLPLRSPEVGLRATPGKSLLPSDLPAYSNEPAVRVVLGPQADRFTAAGVETFLTSTYTVGSASDRMGYRFQGPRIEHIAGPDVVSDGIALGSVQVPGDAQPIVMLADRQTTGGYTKIATVIGADIPLLAQCVPGSSRVRFAAVELAEAVRLRRAQARALVALAGPGAYRLTETWPANGETAEG